MVFGGGHGLDPCPFVHCSVHICGERIGGLASYRITSRLLQPLRHLHFLLLSLSTSLSKPDIPHVAWRTLAHPAHRHTRPTMASSSASAATAPPNPFPQFNPQRIRSYILRLPLCTRVILALIVAFWVAGISHGFQNWASLDPNEVFAGSSMFGVIHVVRARG